MVRLVVYLVTIALIASGLAWLADRPGTLQIVWQGYDVETSVFRAVVLLAATVAAIVFCWSLFRALWNSPAAIGDRLVQRRQRKGLDAVSSGLIAIGAGDGTLAISAECLNVELRDVTRPYIAPSRKVPQHPGD